MNDKTLPVFIMAPTGDPLDRLPLGRAACCLAAASLAAMLLSSCASDDPQTQKTYYDGWLHPSGSAGYGNNPFSKEFWVGDS